MSAGGLNSFFAQATGEGVLGAKGNIFRQAAGRASGMGRSISKTVFDGQVDPVKAPVTRTQEEQTKFIDQQRREQQAAMNTNPDAKKDGIQTYGYRAPGTRKGKGLVSSVLNLSGQTLTGS